MITKNQAVLILSHAEPLILSGEFKRTFCPNYICVSEETMRRLGIPETALDDHMFYDGKEYHRGDRPVHVFLLDGLEKFIGKDGPKWSDYENARKDAKRNWEVGG